MVSHLDIKENFGAVYGPGPPPLDSSDIFFHLDLSVIFYHRAPSYKNQHYFVTK